MNMEDRLRQAFEREAEHLHAPSGSPETAIRRGRRRRASSLIGGAALVVALIGGTGVGIQVLGDADDPNPAGDETTASQLTESTGDRSGTDGDESIEPPATADIDFDWEQVTLEVPDGADIWNIHVAAVGDRFVAVANGYSGSDEQAVLTWTSSDGRDWSQADTSSALQGQVEQIFSTGEGFVAVAREYGEGGETTLFYTSADGLTWTGGAADLGPRDEYTFNWFSGAAAGGGITVVTGALQTEPAEPPIVFEDRGLTLEPQRYGGGYDVVDLDSGRVITSIDGEVIWGGEPAVYDATGNRLFAIPYTVLEDNIGAEETGGVGITEIDGYRLEMDFDSYTFTVTEIATGTVVVRGDQEELYRPPRVTITDPATGAVVLDITIDEFMQAEQRSYQERDDEFFPKSTPLVLVSDDGATWDRVEVPTSDGPAQGIDVGGITHGPNGFLLSMNRYGNDSARGEMLQSSNGRDWQLLDGDRAPRDGPIVTREGRYYSVGYGGGSSPAGVRASTDATEWTTVFGSPSRDVFYNSISAGQFGIVVLGQQQDLDSFGPPLRISKEGRTLVLDYRAGSFTVIEDATGDELAVVEFDIWAEEAPEQFIVDDETGTVTILDEDGTVLMTVTEEEGEVAAEQLEEEYGDVYGQSIPQPAVAFSPDGDTWFTVSTDGLDVAWAQSMAVGTDSVVIVGESLDAYRDELASGSSGATGVEESPVTTLVTTDASVGLRLWVGTRG